MQQFIIFCTVMIYIHKTEIYCIITTGIPMYDFYPILILEQKKRFVLWNNDGFKEFVLNQYISHQTDSLIIFVCCLFCCLKDECTLWYTRQED